MTQTFHIEPYTLRLAVTGTFNDPVRIVAELLSAVAEDCEDAGAALIGHIKAHARTSAGNFRCSYTSTRSGSQCTPLPSFTQLPVSRVDVDLAVLVYGLDYSVVDAVTREAIDAICTAAKGTWETRSR